MKGIDSIQEKSSSGNKSWRKRTLEMVGILSASALAAVPATETENADAGYHEVSEEYTKGTGSVRVYEDRAGNRVFVHEDLKIRSILNYLAGVGQQTDEELFRAFRFEVLTTLKKDGEEINSKEVREKVWSMNDREAFVGFYEQHAEEFFAAVSSDHESARAFGEFRVGYSEQKENERRSGIEAEFYERLWEYYIQAGAPKIEYIDMFDELKKSDRNKIIQSRYDRENNTVYLDNIGNSQRRLYLLIHELSHALSWQIDPEEVERRKKTQVEFVREGETKVEKEERFKLIYNDSKFNEGYVDLMAFTFIANNSEHYPALEAFMDETMPRWRLQLKENSIE